MDYWHRAWTCPFFKWDKQQLVGCEGGKLCFPDKESAIAYMDTYCAHDENGWKKCSVAASLLEYYDRLEKEKTP